MRKVFKIVCAEGQFHEIYNYEETKKLFKIIPSTKALVIVQAKVMIGYDFEKCVGKDEQNQKIRIVSFPDPEILSVEFPSTSIIISKKISLILSAKKIYIKYRMPAKTGS